MITIIVTVLVFKSFATLYVVMVMQIKLIVFVIFLLASFPIYRRILCGLIKTYNCITLKNVYEQKMIFFSKSQPWVYY